MVFERFDTAPRKPLPRISFRIPPGKTEEEEMWGRERMQRCYCLLSLVEFIMARQPPTPVISRDKHR